MTNDPENAPHLSETDEPLPCADFQGIKPREAFKDCFADYGKRPSANAYFSMIASALNQADDGIFKQDNEPLALVAVPNRQDKGGQVLKLYSQCNNDSNPGSPDWLITLKPKSLKDNQPVSGFGIVNQEGKTRLLLDSDGNLEVSGAATVGGNLDVKGATTLWGGLVVSANCITLGLEKHGGGRLVLANKLDDNKIFLEAWGSTGEGSASELLLTGNCNNPVPQVSIVATETRISGNVTVKGDNLTVHKHVAAGSLDVTGTVAVKGDAGLTVTKQVSADSLNLGGGTADPKDKLTVTGAAKVTGGLTVTTQVSADSLNLGGGTADPKDKLTVTGDAIVNGNFAVNASEIWLKAKIPEETDKGAELRLACSRGESALYLESYSEKLLLTGAAASSVKSIELRAEDTIIKGNLDVTGSATVKGDTGLTVTKQVSAGSLAVSGGATINNGKKVAIEDKILQLQTGLWSAEDSKHWRARTHREEIHEHVIAVAFTKPFASTPTVFMTLTVLEEGSSTRFQFWPENINNYGFQIRVENSIDFNIKLIAGHWVALGYY